MEICALAADPPTSSIAKSSVALKQLLMLLILLHIANRQWCSDTVAENDPTFPWWFKSKLHM